MKKMQLPHENYPTVEGDEEQSLTNEKGGDKNQAHHPNVAVLGSGFGGLWAARTLADGPVNVKLIDRHNYHTFFPLLYQVGAAELEPEDIAQPLRKVFWKRSNVRFYLGEVQEVNLSAKVVRIPGHEIRYDYLVVALGSEPNFYGIPGAAEYVLTLKSLDEGVVLRNQILTCFERAACEVDTDLRLAWLTLTIVGGGPTGVEFASEHGVRLIAPTQVSPGKNRTAIEIPDKAVVLGGVDNPKEADKVYRLKTY
jgi:NADH dehydrogenase FAD-containing subunit